MLEIRYTKRAKVDLDNIFALIFEDKQGVALEYLLKIKDTISLLKENSMMGVSCRSKGVDRDCRVLIFDDYLIFYKILSHYISIVKILHSKQNYKKGKK